MTVKYPNHVCDTILEVNTRFKIAMIYFVFILNLSMHL